MLGREGEEGTTAELGEGGVLQRGEGEEEGEEEGEHESGTGDEGSERHEEEDKDDNPLSRSNDGEEGGWNPCKR